MNPTLDDNSHSDKVFARRKIRNLSFKIIKWMLICTLVADLMMMFAFSVYWLVGNTTKPSHPGIKLTNGSMRTSFYDYHDHQDLYQNLYYDLGVLSYDTFNDHNPYGDWVGQSANSDNNEQNFPYEAYSNMAELMVDLIGVVAIFKENFLLSVFYAILGAGSLIISILVYLHTRTMENLVQMILVLIFYTILSAYIFTLRKQKESKSNQRENVENNEI